MRGFGDPNAVIQTDPNPPFDVVRGKSILYQYDPYNPDDYLLPWHLDTRRTSAQAIPSTSHAWSSQHESLNITVPTTPGAPTTALNNNWVPTHYVSDGPDVYWYTMGYYERGDIPFQFALAETFTAATSWSKSLVSYWWVGVSGGRGAWRHRSVDHVCSDPGTGAGLDERDDPDLAGGFGRLERVGRC